jgi:hypothetical protein
VIHLNRSDDTCQNRDKGKKENSHATGPVPNLDFDLKLHLVDLKLIALHLDLRDLWLLTLI